MSHMIAVDINLSNCVKNIMNRVLMLLGMGDRKLRLYPNPNLDKLFLLELRYDIKKAMLASTPHSCQAW